MKRQGKRGRGEERERRRGKKGREIKKEDERRR